MEQKRCNTDHKAAADNTVQVYYMSIFCIPSFSSLLALA